MTRNRLDEIVDEVLQDWNRSGGCDMELFKKVAERAFRHGVEQGGVAWANAAKFIDAVNPKEFSYEVQPAPAGGKGPCPSRLMDNECPGCEHPQCWHTLDCKSGGMGKTQKCQRCLHPEDAFAPHSCYPGPRPDRRKGVERRKDQESHANVEGREIWQPRPGNSDFWYDRRSGKERRK